MLNLNGDRLRLARLLHGYTQQELGDYASVSRQFVHQMEGGDKQPANDVLLALCEALQVNKSFLFSPTENEVKAEQCHFRKRRTTPVGLANRVVAYSTIFEMLVKLLNEYLELPRANFPRAEAVGEVLTNEEIELAAETCRKHWSLGLDNPIADVTKVLEHAGVVITHFNGVSDKVDALSVSRKYPIIIRNTAKPSACRMRFDLAHECGHFILHEGIETGEASTEREADKFASAFIFPRMAFLNEFPDFKRRRINWSMVYNLKKRWGMSARAIIYRAHFLEKISAKQYRSANVWLNKTGQSKVERYDDEIIMETPTLLKKSFMVMREDIGISSNDIATKLGISSKLLSQVTGLNPDIDNSTTNVFSLNAQRARK